MTRASRHRSRPGFPRRVAWGALRAAMWIVLSLLGLAVATVITMALGYVVYVYQGRPNNYEDRKAAGDLQRAMYMGPTMVAGRTVSFAGLRTGVLSDVALLQAREWESPRPPEMVHPSDFGGVYQVDSNGVVTRLHLIRRGLPNNLMDTLSRRLRATWMTPSAEVGAIGGSTVIHETTVWRSDRHVMVVQLLPTSRSHFDFIVTVMTSGDAMFDARWRTGGLNPVHRHAKDIAEQLGESIEENL